jgi:hypothetical protein
MDKVQAALRVRSGMNFKTFVGQNEAHELDVRGIVVNNCEYHV